MESNEQTAHGFKLQAVLQLVSAYYDAHDGMMMATFTSSYTFVEKSRALRLVVASVVVSYARGKEGRRTEISPLPFPALPSEDK